MAVTVENRLRYRAILIGREVKSIFHGVPDRFARRLVGRWLGPALWRWLFLSPDGEPTRAGEVLLAELREFAFVGRTTFDSDPLVMARREGRREVVLRILNYLNLDEVIVRKLMELDDGLGE